MYKLYQGDCLKVMHELPDQSIDLVLTDPPYGTTRCKWDSVIPLEPMWCELKRIIKPRGAIVLTAAQPFTSALVMSNAKMFRYDLKWVKNRGSGFLNANRMPLRAHEDICVFYQKLPTYNPQKKPGKPYSVTGKQSSFYGRYGRYGSVTPVTRENKKGDRHPLSWGLFSFGSNENRNHPTQKPVSLMEYLIRTYTNQGETVLDFTMGSGTTGVAARNLARYFIGIELDAGYFKIASDRIENA